MTLKEKTLFENIDKVKTAIKRLKVYEPPEGYYLAFSGGKDSIVIKQLAIESGVKFDSHYSVTTIDPPDLIYYMKKYHNDITWDRPKKPFLIELVERGFPMRQRRWCCAQYKERGGEGRRVITGIRWEESYNRRTRQMVEPCNKGKGKTFLHVIIDWTSEDVWEFIRLRNLPYCKLYDEGWKRIGCLLCPYAGKYQRLIEAKRYPGYRNQFIRAFEKLHKRKKEKGLISCDRWKDGKEMFEWWISDKPSPKEIEGGLFTRMNFY